MKRMTCMLAIVAATALAPASGVAQTGAGSVTGAVDGPFGEGAALGAVALEKLEVGTGVLIESDGTAVGTFHAVLQGRSVIGEPQQISVTGKISEGSVNPEGGADFSGIATIDLGDGTPPLPGIPFRVSASSAAVILAIDSTTLPAAQLTGGSLTVE